MVQLPFLSSSWSYQSLPYSESEESNRRFVQPASSSVHLPDLFPSLLLPIVPTWIHGFIVPNKRKRETRPPRPGDIAWLDGLRGVASLIVSIFHYTQPRHNFWGGPFWLGPYGKEDGLPVDWTNPFQLPIIRLGFSGVAMVAIFFVISGYVLSFSKVTSIRAQNYEKLSAQLFSSTIRRGFRLFPPVVALFVIMHFVMMFVSIHGNPTFDLSTAVRESFSKLYLLLSTVFKIEYRENALMQFWTIPIEFTNSMILFTVTMGVSRLKTPVRITSVGGIALWALLIGYWGIFLFLAGWIMAEAEAVWQPLGSKLRSTTYYVFWSAMLLAGLVLAGYPMGHIEHDYLLFWIPSVTPQVYLDTGEAGPWFFAVTLGAPMVVWPIFRMPILQKMFTTRLATYLGEISYALYAVHYHILALNNDWIMPFGDAVFGTPSANMLVRTMGILFEVSIYLFIVLWWADLFWRYVDIPTVRLTRYVENLVRVTNVAK